MQQSRLIVAFKDNEFTALRRSEFYGYTDFLANCGGLLGLFMGVSVLSLIEAIYYFTLHLFCTYHLERQRQLEESASAAEKNYPDILIATPSGKLVKY